MKGKMKFLVLSLILCLCLSVALVRAYSSPVSVEFARTDLTHTYVAGGNTYTKNTEPISQKVRLRKAQTALTNPCTSCQIGIRLLNHNNLPCSTTVITMNNIKTMYNSAANDNYHLAMARVDGTLLTTSAFGTWYINLS